MIIIVNFLSFGKTVIFLFLWYNESMFTGIIEEVGKVLNVQFDGISGKITIKANVVTQETKIGESIAVNGVCLTVIDIKSDKFTADVMAETFRATNLNLLKTNNDVNLERAMNLQSRFGGHIVSGHIDGQGIVSRIKNEGNAKWLFIKTTPEILNFIVNKGSVALDGVSLTVAYLSSEEFAVSVIPHTQEATTLFSKNIGDMINIENDLIGKYVKKFIFSANAQTAEITNERDEKLQEWLENE